MLTNKRVYVVDDEVEICQLVTHELENYGYQVDYFHTGTRTLEAIAAQRPDICIIDLGLPDMDGLNLVKHLLNTCETGIIILSGRNSLPDKIIGLELGADDFISKPFEPRELVARTNSIARRLEKMAAMSPPTHSAKQAHFDQWVFDVGTLTLCRHEDNHQRVLSAAEAELLLSLLQSPQQILSRDQLMKHPHNAFDRCIDVKMSRLRKKLEVNPKSPLLIKTVYGAGYMLTAKVEWVS